VGGNKETADLLLDVYQQQEKVPGVVHEKIAQNF
jgi:hypothetical protein